MSVGVLQAANKVIDTLSRVRAGIKADKRVHAKDEVSALFNHKKKRKVEKVAWRHRFVCLATRDQEKIPTTDCEKEILYQAGLGEKEVSFKSLELDTDEFKEVLLNTFPTLKHGGGFQLLKCIPNSRKLEVLSMAVHKSPSMLKQRVGNARTYIRPIQKDLELTPIESDDAVRSIEAEFHVLIFVFL